MRILITQEDINKGQRKNPFECPIAKALKRIIKNSEIVVFSYNVTVDDFRLYPKDRKTFQDFIYNYDRGKPVKPLVIDFYKE